MSSGLAKIRGKFTPALTDWVVNPESDITEKVEIEVDKLLTDRRRRVQVFLTALVRRHVERIIFLMGKFPQIEEELFTDRRISSMKNSDLIRLFGVVGDQVEDASDFLQQFVSSEDLKAEPLPSRRTSLGGAALEEEEESADPSEEERKAIELLPADKRKRVIRIFRKVIAKVEEVEMQIMEENMSEPEAKK